MKPRQIWYWVLTMTLVAGLLSSCAEATPTPVFIDLPTETPIPPPPAPRVIVRQLTRIPTSANQGPFQAKPTATITGTVEASPTLPANPLQRPFLMRIDQISVVVGRGLLLQGPVINGALQANASVDILSTQPPLYGLTVTAVYIANRPRTQVKVGDRAGILIGGLQTSDVPSGSLLVVSGGYKSYAEARQQLSGH